MGRFCLVASSNSHWLPGATLGITSSWGQLSSPTQSPMPLTDTALRNLKPTDKSRKVADEKGLYIEVAPSGGKWWRLKYRVAGKEKRLSLGVYHDVSLIDARDRRDDARKLLAKGVDPSEQRKNEMKAAAVRSAN